MHVFAAVVLMLFVSLHHALAAGSEPRKVSGLGFDVTPLTAEQRQQEAAKLNDFQR
jgi:hypothetical protein